MIKNVNKIEISGVEIGSIILLSLTILPSHSSSFSIYSTMYIYIYSLFVYALRYQLGFSLFSNLKRCNQTDNFLLPMNHTEFHLVHDQILIYA